MQTMVLADNISCNAFLHYKVFWLISSASNNRDIIHATAGPGSHYQDVSSSFGSFAFLTILSGCAFAD